MSLAVPIVSALMMLSMSHTCEVQYWKKKRLRKFKEKIKCQKQILLSSYGHHYLINQIHPNSNSCFGQKVTSIDTCYMTCFQLIFFFRIEPSSTQIALIGFVFCKIFQLLLPVTQGLLSSRPPWPPRIQRRIFPSKSKVIL